jgi:hypothetical protein
MLKLQDFVPNGKILSLGKICERFSEKTSLLPDSKRPFELWLSNFHVLEHPYGAMATLVAISFVRPGWSSYETIEKLVNHIWFLTTKAHNSEGRWMIVREILSQDFYRFGERGCLEKLIPYMSYNDFFGNFLPKVYSIIENNLYHRNMLKAQKELSRREKYRGIRRKIRRRGYNDKGSLRPSHRSLPDVSRDVFVLEQERLRQQRESELPQLKVPPPRYWYKSQFPGSD